MNQLKAFGLSVHAARAYLALLELGAAEARGVSELANIPTTKVYATLAQLQKRGLAQVTPGKPRTYSAVPMGEFIERHLHEQEEQTKDLRARAEEIARLFPIVGTAVLADRTRTIMLSGKRNILQRFREACAATEESIFAVVAPELARPGSPIRRLLDHAGARGVDVNVLTDPTDIDLESISGASPGESIVLATFDEQTAMLLRLAPLSARDRRVQETAIHTSEPAFVRPLRRLIAMQCVVQHAGPRPGGGTAPVRVVAQVDPRVFAKRVAESIAHKPRHACALIPAGSAEDLTRDRLWRAASAAASARIVLAVPAAHRIDPVLGKHVPPHAEVKCISRPAGVAFAVLDGAHAFFTSPSRAARETTDEALYAITQDAAIVQAFEAQFEASWATASPFPHRP